MNPVVIVGAGPYGLSLASYLRSLNVKYRIFGAPMRPWMDNMPPGMVLKSRFNASDLYDPKHSFTIKDYYRENGRIPNDMNPIETETFVNYALQFQKRFVPDLCTDMVTHIEPNGKQYRVQTSGNENIIASAVIIAVGVYDFAYIPEQFNNLDKQFLTHSSQYGNVDHFKDKDVAVVGAGASAIDLAIALQNANARVSIVTRRKALSFHLPPETTFLSKLGQIRYPSSPLGAGWRIMFCAHAPSMLYRLPFATKHKMATMYLGPSPGWSTKERAQKIETFLATKIVSLEAKGQQVHMIYERAQERLSKLVDHIIVATGYRPNINKLSFLESSIVKLVDNLQGIPILSSNFETSSPGLYAIGPIATSSFGPIMRFVYGADFTSRVLSKHLNV